MRVRDTQGIMFDVSDANREWVIQMMIWQLRLQVW